MAEWECMDDLVAKFLLTHQKELLFEITKSVTNVWSKTLEIINSEILPEDVESKEVVFDLFFRNNEGVLFDVEIQNGPFNEEFVLRMEYYGSKMLTFQLKAGDKYAQIRDAYVIVLLNHHHHYNQLIEPYYLGNKEIGELEGNAIHCFVVNMSYIKEVVKQKGLHNLTTFERIIYAMRTNLKSDILELGDEVIKTMYENKQLFLKHGEHFLNANEMAYWNRRKEADRIKYIAQLETTNTQLNEKTERYKQQINELLSLVEKNEDSLPEEIVQFTKSLQR